MEESERANERIHAWRASSVMDKEFTDFKNAAQTDTRERAYWWLVDVHENWPLLHQFNFEMPCACPEPRELMLTLFHTFARFIRSHFDKSIQLFIHH